MEVKGENLIGGFSRRGLNGVVRVNNPSSGELLPGEFGGASEQDLEEAANLAAEAFTTYRETSLERRAKFLKLIAQNIAELDDKLIERCIAESGLPRARVEGECARTVYQLQLFADVVSEGSFLGVRIDPSMPDRKPLPRPDIRTRNIALGPVAVFGASNFPLAVSVAGNDTASALAAGCPVVVKAHSAHPGTSELVGRAIQKAVEVCDLPPGVFALLFDPGYAIGQSLVAHEAIAAVGFTGSRAGGEALMKIAAARKRPIPVFAEMSAVNPVIIFPNALATRGATIGRAFASALTLGVGQFCTNPGLVVAVEGKGLSEFLSGASETLSTTSPAPMLTSGIHSAYCKGVDRLRSHQAVRLVAEGAAGNGAFARAALFKTTAEAFLFDRGLQDEIFGPVSLVVAAKDWAEVKRVLQSLEGQLTTALHVDPVDYDRARDLLSHLETLAGRLIINGFGTGVEVGHAIVHGGPYPATSDGRTSSIGSLAIERFLRPVAYQDFPVELQPQAIQNDNPLKLKSRQNGFLS
ncbi:aldehyde dehydrogenase (NADP(+)) [Rhodopseudomonas pseudopalustris]|uniref:aldehyde dehydrogenase (NADP(+)) n=1 Tax=Rhodopseudomonas pseudopalustris TaxID=1513892 RepID=UPI000B8039FD|nr:aldehyde dehydrogenase (NADP(+)) [Rhodopseudomonas pseudopalustris]